MLKRLMFAVLSAGLLLLPGAVHADVQDFAIDSFDANYLITRDQNNVSEAYVREGIVAVFPDTDQNHGILRALPETYNGHSLEVNVDRVTDERGSAYNYETYSENGNTVVKIGDKDTYVHGVKKYFIDYHMRGIVSKQAEQDEFYWNINGTQWQQPVGKVSVRVHVDDAARGNVPAESILTEMLCYTGVTGSTASDCKIIPDANGAIFESTRAFNPGENLTVVMGFNKGTFADYQPSLERILGMVAIGAAIVLPPLIALWVVVRNWRRYGRDPDATHAVVPEYLPPKEASVIMSETVLKEGVPTSALPAQMIDLAVRHCIKIYEIEKKGIFGKQDYEVELVKVSNDLRSEEKQVLEMLFPSLTVGDKVRLSELTGSGNVNAAKISTLMSDKENSDIYAAHKFRSKAAELVESMTQTATNQGYFRGSPGKARAPYVAVGVILELISFFFFPASLGLALAGAILLIGSTVMPARTAKGVELRVYLLGLRDYIKLAEADRLRVLQSPHGELTEKIDVTDKKKLVKLYERLLPYAMLFGLEKAWAKELAPLYEQEPDWYHSSRPFNSVYFVSSFSGFNTAASTTFAPPSSSSGSGFSGGSSGGGGGGGGGGGW